MFRNRFLKRNQVAIFVCIGLLSILIILAILQATIPFESVIGKPREVIDAEQSEQTFIWEDSDIVADFYSGANSERYYDFPTQELNLNAGSYTLSVAEDSEGLLYSNCNGEFVVIKKEIERPRISLRIQRNIYQSYDITPILGGTYAEVKGNDISVRYLADKAKLSLYFIPDFIYNYLNYNPIDRVDSASRQLIIVELPVEANIEIH